MSGKKKLPTELDIEELLKIVDEVDQSVITKKEEHEEIKSDVFQFIIYYDLKPGYHKVPKELLRTLYCYWSGNRLNQTEFTKRINSFIPDENKYGKQGHYFRLNKSIASITKSYEDLKPRKLDFRKSKVYKKLMDNFISRYSLKPGKFYVEADILYYLFCTFLDERNRQHISMEKFTSLMNLFFDTKDLGLSVSWYGLTEDITTHIPKELVDNWRQGRIKYGKRTGSIKKKSKHYAQWFTEKNLGNDEKVIYEEALPPKPQGTRKIPSTRRYFKFKIKDGGHRLRLLAQAIRERKKVAK